MSKFVDPFAPAAKRPPHPKPQPPAGEPRIPERMNKPELITWAKDLGLSTEGTKSELVARIRAAV